MSGRITTVDYFYYQPDIDQDPIAFESPHSEEIDTDEEVYSRKQMIREEDNWVSLDHGWVEEYSYLIIRNLEGTNLQVNPEEDERTDIDRRILAVSGNPLGESNPLLILPGTHQKIKFLSRDPRMVRVKSYYGDIQIRFYFIPGDSNA